MSGNIRDYGAVGDGVTDDTAAIRACMAAHHRVEIPPGDYVVQAQQSYLALPVRDGQHVWGHGRASRIVVKPSRWMVGRPVVEEARLTRGIGSAVDVSGVTLIDFAIKMDVTRLKEQGHAVFFYGDCQDVHIERVFVEANPDGDGVYFGRGTSRYRIINCTAQDCARSGFVVAGGEKDRPYGFISGCWQTFTPDFVHNTGRLVDFEPARGAVQYISVIGCAGPGGIESGNLTDGAIVGCISGQQTHVRATRLAIVGCVAVSKHPSRQALRTERQTDRVWAVGCVLESPTREAVLAARWNPDNIDQRVVVGVVGSHLMHAPDRPAMAGVGMSVANTAEPTPGQITAEPEP